jgi:hypothetical protein
MSPESPFLRPLAEDEIETVQTIEKAARTRYRGLGGALARAAEGPAIASERFAGGETIVAEHHGEPASFVLLQPLDFFTLPTLRSFPLRLVWGSGGYS